MTVNYKNYYFIIMSHQTEGYGIQMDLMCVYLFFFFNLVNKLVKYCCFIPEKHSDKTKKELMTTISRLEKVIREPNMFFPRNYNDS